MTRTTSIFRSQYSSSRSYRRTRERRATISAASAKWNCCERLFLFHQDEPLAEVWRRSEEGLARKRGIHPRRTGDGRAHHRHGIGPVGKHSVWTCHSQRCSGNATCGQGTSAATAMITPGSIEKLGMPASVLHGGGRGKGSPIPRVLSAFGASCAADRCLTTISCIRRRRSGPAARPRAGCG